jgi:hypothetical protein
MPFRRHRGTNVAHTPAQASVTPPRRGRSAREQRNAARDDPQGSHCAKPGRRRDSRRDAVQNRCEAKTDQQGTASWRIADEDAHSIGTTTMVIRACEVS